MARGAYMVCCNAGGSVFVKEFEFFKSQNGLHESWGKSWKPVIADSIEDARKKGCDMFTGARPYNRQAKE